MQFKNPAVKEIHLRMMLKEPYNLGNPFTILPANLPADKLHII